MVFPQNGDMRHEIFCLINHLINEARLQHANVTTHDDHLYKPHDEHSSLKQSSETHRNPCTAPSCT